MTVLSSFSSSPSASPSARRLAASAAALAAVLALLAASPSPAWAAGLAPEGDRLTVTVRDAGGGADGTYEVRCRPSGGSHPDPEGACAAVERHTRWGQDTFAPVPKDAVCTMQYGGPATARITGTWAGRRVDATYDRTNGCAIERWDRLVPLLPEVGRAEGAPGA
ncbi:subtilase-type protease inhibitor [Streptomyces sp. enrichment culture]|uniref:SSI family serine proteinase inhibitor n=1 Tax=Streptomyces sp. MD20-1-1 TaxID=3028668 RepID=UPI0029B39056|nr:SSI family serine proteinase inhibitor [Streptomyces sp. MD20-1-1]